MSVSFVAASSQRVRDSAVAITAAPFTIGFWISMPNGGGDQVPWCLVDAGSTSHYWAIYRNSSNIFYTNVSAGGAYSEIGTTTAMGSNQWTYVLLRVASATNRRISILHSNGVIDNAQSTTSHTPTSISRVALGISDYSVPDSAMSGSIAEYFMTNADIQADGAEIFSSTLRQIAYNGPFSVMNLMGSYFHYRSFRSGLASDQDDLGDVFTKGGAPPTWTNVNAATLGPHVPLPRSYIRPDLAMTRALLV